MATNETLNDLRDQCFANSKEKGFHDGPGKTIGDDIALMHSELSEALEDHRKGEAPDVMWYEYKAHSPHLAGTRFTSSSLEVDGKEVLGKPCGIPSEMADVIIRIFDFCGKHGIDIDRAVREKMAFNRTRPHMHGKKL